MISKVILYFQRGLLTEKEATRLMVRNMLLENLIDHNKYTEVEK